MLSIHRYSRERPPVEPRAPRFTPPPLVHERSQRHRNVRGRQRPEAERPSAIELLTECMGDAVLLELIAVPQRTFVAGASLKGRVEAIPTVVNRPDRQPFRDPPGPSRYQRHTSPVAT